jgi:hypothetical protein
MSIDTTARDLTYDLAVDTTPARRPSPVAAGLQAPSLPLPSSDEGSAQRVWIMLALSAAGIAALFALQRMRTVRPS